MIFESILVSHLSTCSITAGTVSFHYWSPLRGDLWQQCPSAPDNVTNSELKTNH